MHKSILAALLLVMSLFAAETRAGVVYRWQDLTTNPAIGALSGYLEVDESVWRPGGTLSFHVDTFHASLEALGLLAFSFGGDPSIASAVRFDPRPCDPVQIPNCPAGSVSALGDWDFDLTFGSLLTGAIYANSTVSNVAESSSVGPAWTVQALNADGPGSLCSGSVCAGGTGLWVLDLGTVPSGLPEPSTAMLVLISLLGSIAARKAQARTTVTVQSACATTCELTLPR